MVDRRIRRLVKDVRDKRRRAVREFNEGAHRAHKLCQGCSEPWCCYQMVVAGLFEGAIIADHLLRTKQGELFRTAAEQGTEQLELFPDDFMSIDPETKERFTTEWFDRREPCAFLGSDGRCLIYQQRPIACSTCWVVSDPSECSPPSGKKVGSVNTMPILVWGLDADASFARQVFGSEFGQTMVAQLPLGYAVRLGYRLLTEGVAGLRREVR